MKLLGQYCYEAEGKRNIDLGRKARAPMTLRQGGPITVLHNKYLRGKFHVLACHARVLAF